MSKSIIVLEKHFLNKDTTVVRVQGEVYVHNGCQLFHIKRLAAVCDEFRVSEYRKGLVLDAVYQLTTDYTDYARLFQLDCAFFKIIKADGDEHRIELEQAALASSFRALEYVQEQTEEICMTAVKRNGFALEFVREQTPEICMAAVKQNGFAVRLVNEQTPEICLAAVRQDAWALFNILEQTAELCKIAVEQSQDAIAFVDKKFLHLFE